MRIILIWFFNFIYLRIQYVRHLHDKVHKIDERTAPPKEETTTTDNSAAYGLGMGMMMNDTLMITNGGYGKIQII